MIGWENISKLFTFEVYSFQDYILFKQSLISFESSSWYYSNDVHVTWVSWFKLRGIYGQLKPGQISLCIYADWSVPSLSTYIITVWTQTSENVPSGHVQKATAQIRIADAQVWSGAWLSANRIIGYYRMFPWRANARMRLCACAWWCKSAHFAHVRRQFFAWRDQWNAECIHGQKNTRMYYSAMPRMVWLRKFRLCLKTHAYSIILKFLPPKHENFQIENSEFFHISAQNIHCGYSLETARRILMYTHVNPSFTI